MRIVAIGRTQLLFKSILELKDSIGAIITTKAEPEYTVNEYDFERLANEWKIPFVLTNTLDDPKVRDAVGGCDLGISINWTSIVQERHIKLFRLGIINIHCGDLPKYMGNACPNWAILNGDKEIIVSAHFMEGGRLDCGKILNQMRYPLSDRSTIGAVYKWLEDEMPSFIAETVNLLEKNENHVHKYADPNAMESFRCWPRMPDDGFIDWNKSAVEIDRLIRASGSPFAGAYCYQRVEDKVKKLIILKSRVESENCNDLYIPGQIMSNDPVTGESFIGCGRGIVSISKCRYSDELSGFMAGARWKSIRMRLGVRVEDWLWNRS